jgi:lipopolysaccharide transport system ATP-binding protein
MSDIAIRIEDLGKEYRIGAKQEGYKTLRDTLGNAFVAPFRRARHLLRGQGTAGAAELNESIWALKDISFDVKHGEVVGIIGRNGAGKSTLLKTLSRTTEPTEGYAEISGRVGSLLEVGIGFHPELTGRENIYLNGAILGMKRAEIGRKFDEIVAFAEVEKFIDTPVKHYSTGMYLRLAFAVAAHLEPEILLVDEVLAVGDASFQRKCLGKMGNVAKEGRTVLFVSHNMPAISSLCHRAVWLESGQMKELGPSSSVISHYMSFGQKRSATNLRERTDRTGSGKLRFIEFSMLDTGGIPADCLVSGQPGIFALSYASMDEKPLQNVIVSIRVSDLYDYYLFTLSTHFTQNHCDSLPPRGVLWCQVPAMPLAADIYSVYLWSAVNGEMADEIHNAAQFGVVESDVYGSGKAPVRRKHGPLIVHHNWSVKPHASVAHPK